jgi:hypothetical protein
VKNVVGSASVAGRVETKQDSAGQARGTAYSGPAERFWGSTNKGATVGNLIFGVGDKGEREAKVVTVDLGRVGDPVMRAQAEAIAYPAAKIADAATGNKSPAPLEVRVVINVYPVSD